MDGSAYLYKTIRVTRNGGKSTTVSMLPELYFGAVRTFGCTAKVDAFVRKVALELPADTKNCSARVRERLEAHLKNPGGVEQLAAA